MRFSSAFVLVAVLFVCAVVNAQTSLLPVGHRTDLRPLTESEDQAIRTYIASYRSVLSCQNFEALSRALPYLVAIGQSHVPLTRTPKEYLADWQTQTQLLNQNHWFVELPSLSPLREATTAKPIDLVPVDVELTALAPRQPCRLPGAITIGRQGGVTETPIAVFGWVNRSCRPTSPTCGPKPPNYDWQPPVVGY